jgi:hypothetical protein
MGRKLMGQAPLPIVPVVASSRHTPKSLNIGRLALASKDDIIKHILSSTTLEEKALIQRKYFSLKSS